LGMDVHPGLKVSRERLQETADFLHSISGDIKSSPLASDCCWKSPYDGH
jgi:hypothetical protein